jgi:hypothetical protein
VFERNIVYFGTTVPSSLWQVIIASSEALPLISTNLYYAASGASIPNTGQTTDSNPYYADPQFTNPSTADYSMPASSPAYAIQFQPLAKDQGPLPYVP